jgi:hypothetical protein
MRSMSKFSQGNASFKVIGKHTVRIKDGISLFKHVVRSLLMSPSAKISHVRIFSDWLGIGQQRTESELVIRVHPLLLLLLDACPRRVLAPQSRPVFVLRSSASQLLAPHSSTWLGEEWCYPLNSKLCTIAVPVVPIPTFLPPSPLPWSTVLLFRLHRIVIVPIVNFLDILLLREVRLLQVVFQSWGPG